MEGWEHFFFFCSCSGWSQLWLNDENPADGGVLFALAASFIISGVRLLALAASLCVDVLPPLDGAIYTDSSLYFLDVSPLDFPH